MAHFALVENGFVQQVIAVSNCAIGGCIGPDHPLYQENPEAHSDCGSLEFPDTEPLGQAMLAESGFTGTYKQCSYNGNFRSAYPSSGWKYDADLDEFIPPFVYDPVV